MGIGSCEISQIGSSPYLWDISQMVKQAKPKIDNTELLKRLEDARLAYSPEMSQNDWCKSAKVNTSYFTGLKDGVEPGLYKIERLAGVVGLSLADLIEGIAPPPRPAAEIYKMILGMPHNEVEQVKTFTQYVKDERRTKGDKG